MRKKYLYKKCLHIKEINDNIILFFDKSLEDIRKLYNMRRISIFFLFTKYWSKVCKLPKFTTQVVSQICKKGY